MSYAVLNYRYPNAIETKNKVKVLVMIGAI